jgi:hypothetical protein
MAKIISLYLPQYHPIPENDEWWEKGFTEWHNTVRAKKLFLGHKQPRIPADLGFYDLRLPETRVAQAEMAKRYGVEGFCYWHYWFGGDKRLLDRPFREVLESGNPNFPFCLGWANHSWYKKNWGGKGKNKLLIEQKYLGRKDYEKHFFEMLPAFKDERYIRVDNRLFFIIHSPLASSEISIFIETWRTLAKEHGLGDFYFAGQTADNRGKKEILAAGLDAVYNYDVFNIHHNLPLFLKVFYLIKRKLFSLPTVFDYKKAVEYMVMEEKDGSVDSIPTIAPNWDHSPRSGANGIILKNSRPEFFKKLVMKALSIVSKKPENQQVIILASWNEWGEGNYMEPDTEFGHGFLEALRDGIREFESSKSKNS